MGHLSGFAVNQTLSCATKLYLYSGRPFEASVSRCLLPAVGSEVPKPLKGLPDSHLLGKIHKNQGQISYRGKITPGVDYRSTVVGTRTDF